MASTQPAFPVSSFNSPFFGGFQNMLVFTASTNWVVPSNIATAKATVIAGGGAGHTGNPVAVSNGAAGGTAIKYIRNLAAGLIIPVTIGAGGVANGGTGGTSSFGSFCSATGGAGGQSTTQGYTSGGLGVGGDWNIQGQNGGPVYTIVSSVTQSCGLQVAVGYLSFAGQTIIPGIAPWHYSLGTTGQQGGLAGRANTGAGGTSGQANNTGGAGGSGVIILEW